MIKANTNILVGKRTFQGGQAVKGLSPLDKRWMLVAGYISEIPDTVERQGRKAQKPVSNTPSAETGEGQ